MDKKRDLRVQKTYDALSAAFCDLLQGKSFEEMTVKELCAAARIRPATFYTHFRDKYDYFDFMIRELRENNFGLFSDAEEMKKSGVGMEDLIREGFDYVDRNADFLKALDRNSMLVAIMDSADGYRSRCMQTFLEEAKSKGAVLAADPVLLAEALIGILTQSARWWFENGRARDKEDMIRQMTRVCEKLVILPE